MYLDFEKIVFISVEFISDGLLQGDNRNFLRNKYVDSYYLQNGKEKQYLYL